ncbi:MAG: S41 family peptidase [Bacteroidales bacterium]
MLDETTGYIRFTNFTQDCSKDVREALISLTRDQKAGKIILDLRSNPGGLLTEAVDIVNLLVGPGQEVVSTRAKVNQYDATYKTTRPAVNETIPLVVMINSNSASASEIVAGAIQDLDRGVVIGHRSYGKGLVQISRPLSYNSSLKVTTAKYYIPSGRCIQALDFTHRNEDGSVGHIPDSLISEFRTKNGRVVRDGGGIVPDYTVESLQLSQVSSELFFRSLIFDYATLFARKHSQIDQPASFSLDDESWKEFVKFLEDRNFSYNTATEEALERLETMARREKYYDPNQEMFAELREKLGHNLQNDLELFRTEITKILEDEIVGRYYYEDGVIMHNIGDDLQVQKAIEVLRDDKLYSSTLKGETGTIVAKPLPEEALLQSRNTLRNGTEISG